MKRLSIAVSVFLGAFGLASAQPLDPLFQDPGLWQTKGEDFVQRNAELGFVWVSSAHEAAQSTQEKLTLFSLPVLQALARFQGETLAALEIQFYNRGDAGEISKEQFQDQLRKSVDALSTHTGLKPTVLGKDPHNAVKADAVAWQASTGRYQLSYSFVREVKTRNIPFRAEFIRLEVTPATKQEGALQKSTRSAFSGTAHVKKMPNGDVLLEGIPMVDQGEKGYCVVASVERVLRYYGGDVDANELAQVANSSATAGTSVEAMMGSLKKLGNRLRIRVRAFEEMDVRSIEGLVADYNRVAKREKAPLVAIQGHVIDVNSLYLQMRPELLVRAQTKSDAPLKKLLRTVQTEIDKGCPLLWSVMLGIVPEGSKNQTGVGGHMRLIIGYNTKTSEILYSDSWGAGHELKRHNLSNAWAITTGLFGIQPLSSF